MYLCTIRASGAVLSAIMAVAMAVPVAAHNDTASLYDLPARDLATSLRDIARISGAQMLFAADLVKGQRAPALRGDYTPIEAVEALLAGSGLTARQAGDVIIIKGPSTPAKDEKPDIVVTGTRIRGQAVASPLITRTQRQLQNEGFANVGDAMRALPQNFNGGQNPGVAVGAGGSPENENVGSGSTINLRGIGQEATLTLFNGHRMAYNINAQGVDVSTIPLAALDRIEVVPDGASALYGSDAVAGVANIILKRDYQGVLASARLGNSTDGGDFQQQYDVVAGRRWSSGGAILTYDFERSTAIRAGDRSYTGALYPDDVLLPYQRRHAVILSVHQDLGSDVSFSIDGTFNKRWSHQIFSATPTADYLAYGELLTSHDTAFSVAPSLRWRLPFSWAATVSGVYAEDHAHYSADVFVNAAPISQSAGCYCNSFKSIEAGAEGPLFHLPAGDIRVALGGGYRQNGLDAYRTVGSPLHVNTAQGSYFAYGEAALPLFSPDQGIQAVHSLKLDAAIRYERYPGIAQVTTPKLGFVYAPTAWVDIKGSWGRSFKAPTLYQLHQTVYSQIFRPSQLGGVGYPTNATIIELTGGNPDLKPERAETWTATLDLHPLPKFHAILGYYHVDYRDRVVQPILSRSGTLSNPIYAQFINASPTQADKAAATDPSLFVIQNNTTAPLNLSNVVAVIDDRNLNISRQTIHGFDASLQYEMDAGKAGILTLDAASTYLVSRQIYAPGQASVPLAGIIFNPPHWRGRGGLSWNRGSITLSSYASYIGSVEDNRFTPHDRVGSLTSWDLAGRYEGRSGALRGTDVILSVQNLLNAKPALIRTTISYDPAYDSTNYSAVGRFVSLSLAKKW